MGRFIYYTATSANGYIADENHSLEWLFAVGGDDASDTDDFMSEVGVQVMGAHTYEWLLRTEELIAEPQKWSQFFGTMPTFVVSSRALPRPAGADVHFIGGDLATHLDDIETAAGDRDVWVTGGGDLAGQFLDAGRLDRIVLTVAPVFLSGGAPLLPRTVPAAQLRMTECRPMGSFARIAYDVVR